MQDDRSPGDCRICSKSTASVSEKKKRLILLGSSAEPVRQIIKCYLLESYQIADFSFEEPQFRAGDYICSSCIALLTNYDKAKKRFHELEEAVKASLQAAIPVAVQPPVEQEGVVSPIGRRRARPLGGVTSTPKRLRLESLATGLPKHAQPGGAPVKVCYNWMCSSQSCIHRQACK